MTVPVAVSKEVSTKKFKQPFQTVAVLSEKTAVLTKKVDPAIDKTLDFVYNGISTAKTSVEKVSKKNLYILGAFGALTAVGISFALLIPALIFFPLTILFGTGFLIFGVASTPVVAVLAWLLLSSTPVQSKVVKPALETALKNEKVKKLLLAE